NGVAIARSHGPRLAAGHSALRQLQHIGPGSVGGAGLLRRQRMQRWVAGPGHAFEHAAHGRC
ncbi:MAG: hypothetical protein RIR09_1755, partial [Pseudomonadota bacterium]